MSTARESGPPSVLPPWIGGAERRSNRWAQVGGMFGAGKRVHGWTLTSTILVSRGPRTETMACVSSMSFCFSSSSNGMYLVAAGVQTRGDQEGAGGGEPFGQRHERQKKLRSQRRMDSTAPCARARELENSQLLGASWASRAQCVPLGCLRERPAAAAAAQSVVWMIKVNRAGMGSATAGCTILPSGSCPCGSE